MGALRKDVIQKCIDFIGGYNEFGINLGHAIHSHSKTVEGKNRRSIPQNQGLEKNSLLLVKAMVVR